MESAAGTPFGNRIQLVCEHGYMLRVSEEGEVSGTDDTSDPLTRLEITAGTDAGTVRIQGQQSELYLAFDDNGQLAGRELADATEISSSSFKESFNGSYTVYESVRYPGWMIALSKKGVVKNGRKTQLGKKSTRFLPIRL